MLSLPRQPLKSSVVIPILRRKTDGSAIKSQNSIPEHGEDIIAELADKKGNITPDSTAYAYRRWFNLQKNEKLAAAHIKKLQARFLRIKETPFENRPGEFIPIELAAKTGISQKTLARHLIKAYDNLDKKIFVCGKWEGQGEAEMCTGGWVPQLVGDGQLKPSEQKSLIDELNNNSSPSSQL